MSSSPGGLGGAGGGSCPAGPTVPPFPPRLCPAPARSLRVSLLGAQPCVHVPPPPAPPPPPAWMVPGQSQATFVLVSRVPMCLCCCCSAGHPRLLLLGRGSVAGTRLGVRMCEGEGRQCEPELLALVPGHAPLERRALRRVGDTLPGAHGLRPLTERGSGEQSQGPAVAVPRQSPRVVRSPGVLWGGTPWGRWGPAGGGPWGRWGLDEGDLSTWFFPHVFVACQAGGGTLTVARLPWKEIAASLFSSSEALGEDEGGPQLRFGRV